MVENPHLADKYLYNLKELINDADQSEIDQEEAENIE